MKNPEINLDSILYIKSDAVIESVSTYTMEGKETRHLLDRPFAVKAGDEIHVSIKNDKALIVKK